MIEREPISDSQSTRPLPKGWRWVRLGELCRFIRGVSFDKDEQRMMPRDGFAPILRAGNISDRLDIHDDLIWVPVDRVNSDQRLRMNDIVICMSSGSPAVVGKTASVDQAFEGSVGAFCGIIRALDPDNAEYLALWFRSADFRAWRDSQARGANIQNLRFSQLQDVLIPLPPLTEQRRISALLRKQLATVERARAAVEAQLRAAKELPAAYLREVFESDEAREWEPVALGYVCAAVRGINFASGESDPAPFPGSVACLTTSGVQSEVAWSSRRFIPQERVADANQYLVEQDILVSTANSKALVGKSCVVRDQPFPCVFGAFVTVLRIKPGALAEFVALWLRSPAATDYCYRTSSNTTGISNLRVSDLLAMMIPLPPIAEQRRIAAHLREQLATVERARAAAEAQLRAAKELPAAYLRQAFNVEL